MPAQAKDLVKQARTAAESLQGQVLNRTNGRLSPRRDDTDDRDVEDFASGVQGGGRRRVAGDHHQLDIELFEETNDVQGEVPDLRLVARPVGKVPEVGEVDGGLVGQLTLQLSKNGEAAHARVEHPDGARVTHLAAILTIPNSI